MEPQSNIENRLWDYIDGVCSEEEKSLVEQLIASNQEWKEKYKELLEAHQLMANIELEEPSLRFTRNVMEEIGRHHIAPSAKTYINKRVIWGIGAFFLLSIAGFLIYGIGQIFGSEISAPPVSIDSINLDKINFGKLVNSTYTNIFLMINALLGLVLLDMYLRKKKNNLQEETE